MGALYIKYRNILEKISHYLCVLLWKVNEKLFTIYYIWCTITMTIKLKQRKSSNFAILLPFAPCLYIYRTDIHTHVRFFLSSSWRERSGSGRLSLHHPQSVSIKDPWAMHSHLKVRSMNSKSPAGEDTSLWNALNRLASLFAHSFKRLWWRYTRVFPPTDPYLKKSRRRISYHAKKIKFFSIFLGVFEVWYV